MVDAAARRLRAGGPGSVSVRAVADEAGVSTRAVYSLFGSRDELLAELYRRGFAGLAAELADHPEGLDPLAELRALGDAYRRSALARPNLYHAMFDGPHGVDDPDPVARSEATFHVLVDAVRRCVAADLLAGDPVLLARQLWALTHGLALLELSGSLGDDPELVWDQARRAMVLGHAGSALEERGLEPPAG
nr:TetR/AcrR family transcriptional regulator [Salsipaludibacter albus]